ncbi:MAG: hypothetical protein H0X39_02325 [Actinobacteria bacterium]|nr:hypothetical protein [Actinomycetota bacterium]
MLRIGLIVLGYGSRGPNYARVATAPSGTELLAVYGVPDVPIDIAAEAAA